MKTLMVIKRHFRKGTYRAFEINLDSMLVLSAQPERDTKELVRELDLRANREEIELSDGDFLSFINETDSISLINFVK